MRQGILAGLIVVAIGLPLGIVADRHEFVREYDALRAAAGGDMGPFKGIWMKSAEAPATVAEKEGELAQIQRWGAWQAALARNSSRMVRTVSAPENDFMTDLRLLAGSARADTQVGFSTNRFAPLGATTFAIVGPANRNDLPVFATADSERPHARLAALVDQFSIAAHAEEATTPTPQSPATSDVASQTVAVATNGGEDVASASPPFTIVASAGENAAANSSGFVDVVQMHLAGSVGTLPIPASVPGFVDLGINSK